MLAATAVVIVWALFAYEVPAASAQDDDPCLATTPGEVYHSIGRTRPLTAYLAAGDAGCDPDNSVQASADVEIDFEFAGANDPDGGDSPETPDLSCIIPAGGASCFIEYEGQAEGDDVIRAWLDSDEDNATVEADVTEGADEAAAPGNEPEPDATDVALWHWSHADPSQCNDDKDNDNDGSVDYPQDADCESYGDNTEGEYHPTSTYTVTTTLTIRYWDGALQGVARARFSGCQRNRQVLLKKARPGPDRQVASDRTNRKGHWRIRGFRMKQGRYYAVAVEEAYFQGDGDYVRCTRARSETIRL